mmetsp:Transcript_560/g.1284  ORF Transcript_560/g.1284 Transcript_560/m.1284 type:complete len:1538 (-) Transcript_560:24-4637(-)
MGLFGLCEDDDFQWEREVPQVTADADKTSERDTSRFGLGSVLRTPKMIKGGGSTRAEHRKNMVTSLCGLCAESRGSMTFSGTALTGKECKRVMRAMRGNPGLHSIDFSNGGFAPADHDACVAMLCWLLSPPCSITEVNLLGNVFGNKALKILEEGLRSNLSVTQLDVEYDPNHTSLVQVHQYVQQNKAFAEVLNGRSAELRMTHRAFTALPHHLQDPTGFQALRILDVSNNAITSLPDSIVRISSLQSLDVSSNQLTELPADLGMLLNLKELLANNNKLAFLPDSMRRLHLLTRLHIADNRLTELPSFMAFLKNLEDVSTANNPVKSIPAETLAAGNKDLLDCLLKTTGTNETYRMRIMLVGHRFTGKTTLYNALANLMLPKEKRSRNLPSKSIMFTTKTKPPKSEGAEAQSGHQTQWAVGITLADNKRISVQFEVCDLPVGSEEENYSCQQLFFTPRTLYLVVFNAVEREQLPHVDHWLELIHSRAGNAPILLVGTHTDDRQCTQEYIEGIKTRLFSRQSRYKSIKGLHMVNPKAGVEDLQRAIMETAVNEPYMPESIPAFYEEIGAKVRDLGATKPFLTYADFCELCKNHGVTENLLSLALFLHDIGEIFYFPNISSDFIMTNPLWVKRQFVLFIEDPNRVVKEGMLLGQDITRVWSFEEEVQQYLLDVFEINFELVCFLKDDCKIFIPNLLSDRSDSKNKDITLLWPPFVQGVLQYVREYRLDFLPYGFLSRLITRFMQSLEWKPREYWKNGVLLSKSSMDKELVLVEVNPTTYRMKMSVRGPNADTNLSGLTEAVEPLCVEVLQLQFTVFVPCTHCIKEKSYDPFKFSLAECEDAVTSGKSTVMCRGTIPVNVSELVPDVALNAALKVPYSELEVTKVLGEGAFAKVFKAKWNDECIAVKQLFLTGDDKAAKEKAFYEFRQEVHLMSSLHHLNIVGLLGVVMEPFCMLLEFMNGGSLYEMIHGAEDQAADRISPTVRLQLSFDIAQGMNYLHSFNPPIIHRDLKSPNVLLTHDPRLTRLVAKVADFGLSRKMMLTDTFQSKVVDNPVWLAPEILQKKNYNEKVDVYSFGVIMWELLTQEMFFGDITFMAQMEDRIIKGERPPIPEPESPIDEKYGALIRGAWSDDPEVRPPFLQLRNLLMEIAPDVLKDQTTRVLERVQTLKMKKDDAGPSDPKDTQTQSREPSIRIGSRSEKAGSTELARSAAPALDRNSLQARFCEKLGHPDSVQIISLVGEQVWVGTGGGIIFVWVSTARTMEFSIKAHTKKITAIIPVLNDVWTSSNDGSLKRWSKTGSELGELKGHTGEILSMLFVSDTVWSAGTDMTIRVWSTKPSQFTKKLKCKDVIRKLPLPVCMMRAGDGVWVGTDREILVIDSKTHKTLVTIDAHTRPIHTMLQLGDLVWSCSSDQLIKVWNMATYECVSVIEGHHTRIFCMCSDGVENVWSGGWDKTIMQWNAKTRALVTKLASQHIDAVSNLLVVPNKETGRKEMWSSSWDKTVVIWTLTEPASRLQKQTSQAMLRTAGVRRPLELNIQTS